MQQNESLHSSEVKSKALKTYSQLKFCKKCKFHQNVVDILRLNRIFVSDYSLSVVQKMARLKTKKDDVVNAALVLFMKNGIKATTTRDIALRAGISEGTIYRHFESKDELARIIFEQNLEIFWKYLRQYLRNCKNAEQMLRAYVLGYFEFARRHQRRYSFVISAHQTELRKLSRERIKPMRMLIKILRLGQSQGLFRESNPNLTAAMVIGTLTQTIFYLKNGQIAINYKQVVKDTTDACLRITK